MEQPLCHALEQSGGTRLRSNHPKSIRMVIFASLRLKSHTLSDMGIKRTRLRCRYMTEHKCMQDEPSYQGEQRRTHALGLVQDWASDAGVKQVIQQTPVDGITRSRVVDRCALLSSSLRFVHASASRP